MVTQEEVNCLIHSDRLIRNLDRYTFHNITVFLYRNFTETAHFKLLYFFQFPYNVCRPQCEKIAVCLEKEVSCSVNTVRISDNKWYLFSYVLNKGRLQKRRITECWVLFCGHRCSQNSSFLT
jgi:hypothetical protein